MDNKGHIRQQCFQKYQDLEAVVTDIVEYTILCPNICDTYNKTYGCISNEWNIRHQNGSFVKPYISPTLLREIDRLL